MNQPAKPTRLRWYQYSLRSLLIFIAILSIPLAWVAKERAQSKRELAISQQLNRQGTTVLLRPYDKLDIRMVTTDPRWNVHVSYQHNWLNRFSGQLLGQRISHMHCIRPNFDGLELLQELTRMQWIEIGDLRVKDLSPLSGLSTLEGLILHSSQVHDLAPLARLIELKWLRLSNSQIHNLSPLTSLHRLEYLDVSSTKVADLAPLAKLGSLRVLWLRNTQVRDLTALASLTKLIYLDIRSTKVTKDQIDALQKALPNCNIDHDPFPE